MSSITCPNAACAAVLEGTDLRHCPRCGAFLPLAQEADPVDPLVGQPILGGKYRILSIIGEGGMGKVYLAEQKLGNATRKVAIKTLQPDLAQDPQIIARFHRETQTVIELEHPNTIKFFDFGELEDHGKKLFVVMEFIQGESLAQVLSRGPLEVPRTERILSQICGSLQEAHDHGVVHRDLKPENIYLTQRGKHGDFVKVLDFGIAKRDEARDDKEAKLTRQGMVLGTPPYMSPEQFTGQTLDARSDIYALAVMAYEMLTGALPFTAATPWEWATKHLTAQPIAFEQQPNGGRVPPRHRAAILKALSKNREERQASVTDFLMEFSGDSGGATDWTASSTSLPHGNSSGGFVPAPTPAPISGPGFVTNPTVASSQQGYMTGPGMPPPGHAAHTPHPFAGPGGAMSQGGFVASPSSAGFAAVPPMVAPGAAGSNPGFANPTSGGFSAIPGMPSYGVPPAKSRKGLVIGVIVALAVLAGGGGGLAYYFSGDDDDDAPAQAQQRPSTQPTGPTVPTTPVPPTAQGGTTAIPTPPVQPPTQPVQVPTPPRPTTPDEPTPIAVAPPTPAVPTEPVEHPHPSHPTQPSHPSGGNEGDPRAVAAVSRGTAAINGNNFPGAITALQEASRIDNGAASVGRLRNELRRRGHNRIDNLILAGNCGAAQQLFRQLRNASAAPGTDSFGDACPAP